MSTDSHPHTHAIAHSHDHGQSRQAPHSHLAQADDKFTSKRLAKPARSVLAWPAWLRVAAMLPLVLLLWLAVLWANEGARLW